MRHTNWMTTWDRVFGKQSSGAVATTSARPLAVTPRPITYAPPPPQLSLPRTEDAVVKIGLGVVAGVVGIALVTSLLR
jgi:hypothetical protein